MTALLSRIAPLSTADEMRLARVQELYEQGLYLQAYQLGSEWGALREWPQPLGLVMAARVGSQLGGGRQSDWLMRRAFRNSPHDPDTRYFYCYTILRRYGPYRGWRWMQQQGDLPEHAAADTRSSWYALQGEIAAALRDFTAAERWLDQARQTAPNSAWVRVCASYILEAQDRYDAALAEVQQALIDRPFYRPAVQAVAHLLTLLDRDQEAIELLQAADARLECGAIAGHLFGMQMELKQYEAANRTLERYVQLSPLLEKKQHQWLASQRAEVAYYLGDYDAAIAHAENSTSEFHKAVAERLRNPANREQPAVILPVGFVRQHRVTCAPATLAAISRFWSMPADHLQVADEICYDGTSHYNERKWAADHGWAAREFSVTEDSARELIMRGVPFTFTTVEPSSAHLQAIIGYDGRRGTVLVRDPYWRVSGEAFAEKLFAKYKPYGPRGMVLVPQEKAEKIAGVELPDAALWDLLHKLDHALNTHQREAAEVIAQELEQAASHHRLALEARRRLAMYDGNVARQLAVVEQLIEQFPENPNLQLERLQLQQHQTRRADRLEILEKLCAKPECHPIFWQQLAEELQGDARRREDARRLLRKGIRRWPTEAFNYQLLANIYWDERRYDEALELYRFAACLADKDERLAASYFSAARWRKQTGQVLQLLEDRFRRFGKKSFHPTRTLIRAYLELDREADALAIVEEAVKQRPDDGQLLLYAADTYMHASHVHAQRAQELIEQAKGNSPVISWRRTSARLMQIVGDLPAALAHWREVVALQPLAVDAHRAVVQLLAQTEGRGAALAYLQQVIDQAPHCYPLYELWVEWLREEPSAVRERAIHRALEVNADDAWLQRELAYLLAEQRRFDEAWQHVEIAGKLEPQNPSYLYLCGLLFREQGRLAEAREAMRQTVEASVDADYAIAGWIELCTSPAERREVLQQVKEQLVKQVTFGEGLLAYRSYASETLEAEEVLQLLQDALAARPDLWSAWSACVRQLLAMNRQDDAWPIVEQATQKFPLTPRLWFDRALVARARLASHDEIESLENALRINPSWGVAARALADAHGRRGNKRVARQVLEQVVARDPLDVVSICNLAHLQWNAGEKAAALDRLEKAAVTEPGYEPAWEYLAEYSRELGCADRSIAAARDLTEKRPGEARSWLRLAQALDQALVEERLAAWDKAIELNPQCDSAFDQKAAALAGAERWDEALAACNPPAFGGRPPIDLRLRQAWIESVRGNLQLAVEIIEAIVAEEPHVYVAWQRLADLYPQLGDNPKYLKAAEALVRLSPQYEVSLGYLGEARQLNGDKAGAQEAYARAFELNPRYEFAGLCLFDLQLEAGDIEGAANTMRILRMHEETPFVMARQVQLAAKQQDVATAREALQAVCQSIDPSRWPLRISIQSMQDAGWSEAARQVASDCLAPAAVAATGSCHEELSATWVMIETAAGNWNCTQHFRNLLSRGTAGERAVGEFVEATIRHQQPARFVDFWRTNHEWLYENSFCWGSIAQGFCAFRMFDDGLAWCRDWRQRENLEPWMLVNTIEPLRARGLTEDAVAASRLAVEMAPGHGQHMHCVWLATDAALAGDDAAAAEWLERAGTEGFDPDYQFQIDMLRALLDQVAAGRGNQGAFAIAARKITAAKSNYQFYALEPARRQAYRGLVKRIAQIRGSWYAWLWSLASWCNSFPNFRIY